MFSFDSVLNKGQLLKERNISLGAYSLRKDFGSAYLLKKEFTNRKYAEHLQSNFSSSNTFETMKINSRHG